MHPRITVSIQDSSPSTGQSGDENETPDWDHCYARRGEPPPDYIIDSREQVIVYVSAGYHINESVDENQNIASIDDSDTTKEQSALNEYAASLKKSPQIIQKEDDQRVYECKEESDGDEEYNCDESSDDSEYKPKRGKRRSIKKKTKKPLKRVRLPSQKIKYGEVRVFGCTACYAQLNARTSDRHNLTVHAMKHCDEKRFKCSLCSYNSPQKHIVDKHVESDHEGMGGSTIDQTNDLRKALWKECMDKCFPGFGLFANEKYPQRMDIESMKCRGCSKEIRMEDLDLFCHIIRDHSEVDINYDDPDGVKERFFPESG